MTTERPTPPRRRGGRAARMAPVAAPVSPPMSDEALTHRGTEAPAAPAKLLVLACGALAREITALVRANGWDHVTLHCLPAILHNHPDRIVPAVREALGRIPHETALIGYADCGTGGALARFADELGVPMLPGAHCYAFFEGVETFAERGEMRAFYLTDFLVRQFDAFVTRPLGLDRHPELRDTYFGRYDTLVYQAQTDDPALDASARRHAAALGLGYERRMTGYGDLARRLAAVAG